MKPFKAMVEVTRVPTVNNMYLQNRWGGRRLNPDYKKVKTSISEQLQKAKIPDYSTLPKGEYVFHLDLTVAIRTYFDVRDASNCIKLIEDAIQDVTKSDDALNYGVQVSKLYFDDMAEDKLERIYITITPIKKEDYIYLHSEWNKIGE